MNEGMSRHDDMFELIGPLRAPIKKLPKDKRQQVKAWIAEKLDDPAQPELLLRAFISIGERPPDRILQAPIIARALEPGDILRHVQRLSLTSQTIEAGALFAGLKMILEESVGSRLLSQRIRRVVSGVMKWLKWVDSVNGVLTVETEVAILNLFSLLIQNFSTSKKQTGSKLRKAEKAITPIVELSLRVAGRSRFIEPFIEALGQFRLIHDKFPSSFLERLLEENKRYELLEQFLGHIPTHVKKAVHDGRIDTIEALTKGVGVIPGADLRVQQTMREIWENEPGIFTDKVALVIQSYLGISQEGMPKAIILEEQSEDLQIRQLAMALLFSWEAREDSHKASESFQVLTAVAEKFFNIRLCGQVGSVVEFDSKVHEIIGTPVGKGQVLIVRPWVEWSEEFRKKVIIRALVKPATQNQMEGRHAC